MIVILLFVVIACMRVVQSVCGKRASNEVRNNKTFFLYGIYYETLAAVFSLITLCITGFDNFTVSTMICGFITAVFLMLQFYASLNAIKGCKLIVSQMMNNGGMLICCLLSWVWFGEKMSVLQGVGLLIFFIAAYLLSAAKREKDGNKPQKISKVTWILLLTMMLAEGGVEVSQKYFSLKVGSGNAAWFSFFMFLSSALIMTTGLMVIQVKEKRSTRLPLQEEQIHTAEQESPKTKLRLNKTLMICGSLLAFAVFVINLLVTRLGKEISSVILFPVSASISVCITVIVGWIVYKEKLTMKNLIGVALGLISIIVLATFTPETVSKLFG